MSHLEASLLAKGVMERAGANLSVALHPADLTHHLCITLNHWREACVTFHNIGMAAEILKGYFSFALSEWLSPASCGRACMPHLLGGGKDSVLMPLVTLGSVGASKVLSIHLVGWVDVILGPLEDM